MVGGFLALGESSGRKGRGLQLYGITHMKICLWSSIDVGISATGLGTCVVYPATMPPYSQDSLAENGYEMDYSGPH